MSKGVVRLGDANAAGGLVTAAGCDPSVLVNGRPIALINAPVTPHPPGTGLHVTARTASKPSSVVVGGKPVATWPTVDTCGHARTTGSLDIVIGD